MRSVWVATGDALGYRFVAAGATRAAAEQGWDAAVRRHERPMRESGKLVFGRPPGETPCEYYGPAVVEVPVGGTGVSL